MGGDIDLSGESLRSPKDPLLKLLSPALCNKNKKIKTGCNLTEKNVTFIKEKGVEFIWVFFTTTTTYQSSSKS